ncbi:hypothetical protein QF032_003047 [Streptomyces achromogenes]|uniref:hypothetical protein n=1 Tax=Streptomyces achromogenes TaxID=67255 RepID=UPI002789B7FE|nr:hypothetical protein [Streptomyces achromogenes]MDQ0831203.1 hypothetical protein [Streptomyces achromogenes]
MHTRQPTLSSRLRAAPSPLAAAAALAAASRPDRVGDPVVQRLQSGRTWAGVAASAGLLFAYPLAESGEDILLGKVMDVVVGCGIALVAGLITLSVFIGMARPSLRGVYVRRLTGPGTALGVIALGAGVCGGGVLLGVKLLHAEIIPWADLRDAGFLAWLASFLVFVIVMLIGGIVLAVVAVFTLAAGVFALNSCFRVGDVHDLLPALISPFLVWALFALSYSDGPEVAAPPLVRLAFLLGGPLSVTALSVWEIRRLRHRYGVTMGSALGRGGIPEPTYAPEPTYVPEPTYAPEPAQAPVSGYAPAPTYAPGAPHFPVPPALPGQTHLTGQTYAPVPQYPSYPSPAPNSPYSR